MKQFTSLFLRFLLIILFSVVFLTESALSAAESYYFFVQFTDKNNSPYSLSNPSEYLSNKALTRRLYFGIVCDSTDLPVNANYVNQIGNLGIKVHSRSKWLNGITVIANDSNIMSQVRNFSFVKKVQFTGIKSSPANIKSNIKKSTEDFIYGATATQINQVKGNYLHNLGYTGKDIYVGVLDAGFNNVNINGCFDSLRLQNRLLGTKDIIEPTSNIYAEDAHGANVLSIMTGNKPGNFLGSTPHASFWLIRTEYGPSEYLVETDFWVSGIEFADSVGIDIVNSSLGYTTFNSASMNFTYADMNGKVSRASIAATMAAHKGIIVCNSMGNDGDKTWKYLGSPADADDILSVGAVTSSASPSFFTSFGPSSDFRIKPEVCAMGTATAIVNTSGASSSGNGTSYSTPVITGMMACYLQYIKSNFSAKSISDIIESVKKSTSDYSNPTSQMGYGIPDFQKASILITVLDMEKESSLKNYKIIYNKANQSIQVDNLQNTNHNIAQIQLINQIGQIVDSKIITSQSTQLQTNKISAGIYFVRIIRDENTETFKIFVEK